MAAIQLLHRATCQTALLLLLWLATPPAATAQSVWTARTSAADNNWYSVTYGNGLFVAVASSGTGNRVMTSPDGITWTSRTSAADNLWYSVTYGNGLFVAVASSGTGNRVMTSPDGITWTARASAADNFWYSVTYGNGLFVAVASSGTGNRVMTSPDGITWTSRTSAADSSWYSVIYANGLFVAVAVNGANRVMTSPDGITWTARTAAVNSSWNSLTYGNGLFVAVADGGANRVMTSRDGITWIAHSAAVNNFWYSVTYGNGLFVAVAINGTGNRVMTSPYDAALPVSLRYFDGRMTAAGALLNWATATEKDNARFSIERSHDRNVGPDLSFEVIGNVPSQAPGGNSGTLLTYSFTDTQPLPGINYYRLTQTDYNGTRTLHKIIALSRENQPMVLFPNPAGANGLMQIEPAIAYQRYRLVDVQGRVAASQEQPGLLRQLSVGGLNSGVYVLVVEGANGPAQFRIVVP